MKISIDLQTYITADFHISLFKSKATKFNIKGLCEKFIVKI